MQLLPIRENGLTSYSLSNHNGDAVVSLCYKPPNSPYLRQGEIIEGLFELQIQIPSESAIDLNQPVKLDRIDHPYSIVVSQDCDLEWDYKARQEEAPEGKLLAHVLFCALFSKDELRRDRGKLTNELFRRVERNQDERYHHLAAAPISETGKSIPELFADFKTTFSLPVEFVYWSISTSQVIRRGPLVSPYLEDFMHRLYSFLGRVATPE
jgi:hypothetical protein